MNSDPKKISLGNSYCHENHAGGSFAGHGGKSWGGDFCPMCPGVESDKPGACLICGMALERNPAYAGSSEDAENAALRNMTLRFWIGLALAIPVLVLSMGEFVPGLARWLRQRHGIERTI